MLVFLTTTSGINAFQTTLTKDMTLALLGVAGEPPAQSSASPIAQLVLFPFGRQPFRRFVVEKSINY
jgi:hypothetical protein